MVRFLLNKQYPSSCLLSLFASLEQYGCPERSSLLITCISTIMSMCQLCSVNAFQHLITYSTIIFGFYHSALGNQQYEVSTQTTQATKLKTTLPQRQLKYCLDSLLPLLCMHHCPCCHLHSPHNVHMIQNNHHRCHIDILTTQHRIVINEKCIDMLAYQYVSQILTVICISNIHLTGLTGTSAFDCFSVQPCTV